MLESACLKEAGDLYISVVGRSQAEGRDAELAYAVGEEIARRGHVLVCGGLGGAMEAAARGAHNAGGVTVGILPGADRSGANRWLSVSVPTDMGHARNVIIALSGDAIIALPGGYGTLSEVAFGLKMGKPVIGLQSWDLGECRQESVEIVQAATARQAVDLAEELGGVKPSPSRRPDGGVG